MDSKECLERLYKNLGCESCHNDECKFNSVKNHCDMWTETISQDLERLETLEKFVTIMVNVYKQCIDTPFYKLVNQVNPTSNFLKMVIDQELKNIKDNKDE